MPLAPFGFYSAGAGATASTYWAFGSTTDVGNDTNVVVDSEGNIYWAIDITFDSSRVYKFDAFGNKVWEKAYNTNADQLVIDSSDNLYMRDSGDGRIVKINSATGAAIWGATITGMSVNQIITDNSSNVFIRDFGNERIAKLAAAGNAISWAKQVTESTTTFRAMAIDADGNPWISSTQNSDLRLIEFANSDGSQLTTIAKDSNLEWGRMVVASNGDIIIAERNAGGTGASTLPIRKFNSSGTELYSKSIAAPSGQTHLLQGLALDSSDNLYLLFENDTTDIAYVWKLDTTLSNVWRNGIRNTTPLNPDLLTITVKGSSLYLASGDQQVWKLPTDGSLTGNYDVMRPDGSTDNYSYSTSTLTVSALSALASDTGTATVTNPTVTVASFTPTVTDSSTTFALTEIG